VLRRRPILQTETARIGRAVAPPAVAAWLSPRLMRARSGPNAPRNGCRKGGAEVGLRAADRRRVPQAIFERCRTVALGGHVARCAVRGHQLPLVLVRRARLRRLRTEAISGRGLCPPNQKVRARRTSPQCTRPMRQRPWGFVQTLRDVLVRSSGDPRLKDDPRTAELAVHADRFVACFNYVDMMAGVPLHDDQGTYDRPHKLTVYFDPAKIDAIFGAIRR